MRTAELKAELWQLLSLALPLAAAEAGTQVMSVVDMAVIGRLGGLGDGRRKSPAARLPLNQRISQDAGFQAPFYPTGHYSDAVWRD